MLSFQYNGNLLKPEQRVRERSRSADIVPRVDQKICGIFVLA